MNLRKVFSSLSPCILVLLFTPFIFLMLPNGIPFVYGGCSSVYGTDATSLQVDCFTCRINGQSNGAAIVKADNCSITSTTNKCEISVTFTLTIDTSGCDPSCSTCGTQYNKRCGVLPCGLDTGPSTSGTYTKTHGCDARGDEIKIFLEVIVDNCGSCSIPNQNFPDNVRVVRAKGLCPSVDP